MAGFTAADLVAAGAVSIALFSALLMLALLSRSRVDLLGSRLGWHLVAASLGLFALRGLGLLSERPVFEILEPLSGILAAILLPAGLLLVLRAARTMEREVASAGAEP